MATMTRQEEIQRIWRDYQGLYVVAGVLIGWLSFPFLELIINDLSQLLIGLVPEAIGIGFTVFFLDRIYQQREIKQLKQRLIGEADSKSNETAKSAVDWMRREGWLTGDDGLLKGADLNGANLKRASFPQAYLKGADLMGANLEGANLHGVNLEGVNLIDANLEGAYLGGTNLKGAYLIGANLEEAQLGFATLPDGTKWTTDTDMSRFTDENHPDFWLPPLD